MWHLTCGDLAADSVRPLLADGSEVRVLRDDLAVGPLAGIDTPPCAGRLAFWETLWPAAMTPRPNFSGIAGDALWLEALSGQSRPVTVWHGDSASEQLMLARVAAALEGSSLPFYEVACGTGDSRVGARMAVSMHTPEALVALDQPRPVEPARVTALANQWRAAVAENAAIRRWREGRFVGEDYRQIDHELTEACGDEDMPLSRAMAEVMARCDGFFATDMLLYWRARELAQRGVLRLTDDHGAGYASVQVRRAAG